MTGRLLLLFALLPLALACAAAGSSARPDPGAGERVPFVYVAGYRPEISIFRLDMATGQLTPAGRADGGQEPSFLAWHPTGKFLFALNEVADGRVISYAVDQKTGALTRISDVSSAGVGPAHLSVDKSGRWLLVANYADTKPGTIGIIPIGVDGVLGPAADSRDFGPGTMPHQIRTDPTNNYVFVPLKGGPSVVQLKLAGLTGRVTPNDPDRMPSAPQAGPRHMDFHPNGKFTYVINEQAMTMSVYALDAATGRLTEIETVSTLPAGVTDTKGFSTADVHVHPSGRLLYGSNRGHDSIVIFRIDPGTGKLTLVGHETRTIGKPRNFHIDPTGKVLLVANQDGGTVSVFRIAEDTGLLDLVGAPTPVGPKPSFVGVLMLPGK